MKSIFAAILVILAFSSSPAAIAQSGRLLTVRGEAEVEVPPDFVRLEVLIATEDKDVDDAKAEVDSRTRNAISVIESLGIADEDLSFSGLRLERNYRYDRNDNELPDGYWVSRTVEIKLRDIDSYEQLVHLLVEAGIDELEDAQSGVDDEHVLERAALEAAARAAKLKAQAIATGLGIQLGAPVEVGENDLTPSLTIRQRAASGKELEEILVLAQSRKLVEPMMFVPDNILVRAVVAVQFEIVGE